MKYIILAGILAATLGAAWVSWNQYLGVLDKLSQAEAKIEGYEEAARIHRAHLDRLRQEVARWDEVSKELEPVPGWTGPIPKTEGQLMSAALAEKRGLGQCNLEKGAIREILQGF